MAGKNEKNAAKPRGILRRLAKDEGGNALLIVTAGIFPVLGAVGGGVDLTRAYMAEARLAQTCDAAALAGRKVMRVETSVSTDPATGLSTTTYGVDSAGSTEIQKFVEYNFPDGTFGATPVGWTPTVAADGELTLDLATSVPTSLLKIVGIDTIAIDTECSARRSGNNVDVIMVLDVTGSMGSTLGASTRIAALRDATTNFVGVLDELRDQLDPVGLRVRVGIVPYSQAVNIGKHLWNEDNSYIDTTPQYYVRQYDRLKCESSNNYCTQNDSDMDGEWYYEDGWPVAKSWTGKTSYDLSGYVNRGVAGAYSNPYDWKGCVEMRTTVQTIDASNPSDDVIPAGAWDIIDQEPGVGGAPAWQPYLFMPTRDTWRGRYGPPTSGTASLDPVFQLPTGNGNVDTRLPFGIDNADPGPLAEYSEASGLSSGSAGPNYGCPSEVKLLGEETATDLGGYIAGLETAGNTYHDIGMYWGLVAISSGAPFTNVETYLAPGYAGDPRAVARFIVFMTDGELMPADWRYSAFGIEDYPSDYGNDTIKSGSSQAEHRRRFRLLCEAAKTQGIEISTVAFSDNPAADIGAADLSALQGCATSDDHYYVAASANSLNSAFLRIAQNIGYLRVSK